MSDLYPTPDEQASAYLDGDTSAATRAWVESDPESMARVEAMRTAQVELRAVTPAPDHVREAAIAAALAEFDTWGTATDPLIAAAAKAELDNAADNAADNADDNDADTPADTAHSATPAQSNVVSLRSRQKRYYRMLTAAAAVAVVGVIGASALRNNDGDMEVADTAEKAAEESAQPMGGGESELSLTPSVAVLETLAVIDDPAQLASYADGQLRLAGGDSQFEVDPTAGGGEPAESDTPATEPAGAPDTSNGFSTTENTDGRMTPPSGLSVTCGDDASASDAQARFEAPMVGDLGRVIYQGREAQVVQLANGLIVAIDVATCDTLATALL